MDGGTVADHVIGDVDHEGVAPVCDDRWSWYGAVEGHACPGDSIWSAGTLLDREPVLDGSPCVGGYVVVVGVDGEVSPTVPGGGRVFTCLPGLEVSL